ncbi:Lsr2 family protein [Promicromonospora sp. NPDC052451]|uniref:Lsr2 family protein n=1 Tax=Promicromonospora sp. NPDC052451 TaxID=3364407 RepID=UPI0037C52D7F
MVQKVQLVLEDDIDGGAANETVNFGLDGVSYEIDLNAEHATQLRDALASWVGHARKVKSPVVRGTTTTRRSRSGSDTAAIREWAKANGYTVSDRGRISAEVQDAYAKANG